MDEQSPQHRAEAARCKREQLHGSCVPQSSGQDESTKLEARTVAAPGGGWVVAGGAPAVWPTRVFTCEVHSLYTWDLYFLGRYIL